MRKDIELTGLTAATYTPLDESGEVRLATIEKQADRLISDGVRGAFVCGTTGEGLSLSTEERRRVAHRWVEAADEKLTVIVHVGHNSLVEARLLARHASKIGASGIGAMIPGFFRPKNMHDLVLYCREIAAAAPDLPFYYYHIPSMTGVTGSMIKLLQIGMELIPTLRGIKYTHDDLDEYQQLMETMGRTLDIPFGIDSLLEDALAAGARGAVGSTYNYAAPQYLKMIEAFRRADMEAVRCQSEVVKELTNVLLKHGVVPTGKAIMKMIGLDCGSPRMPLAPLTDEACRDVRTRLKGIGILGDQLRGGVGTPA